MENNPNLILFAGITIYDVMAILFGFASIYWYLRLRESYRSQNVAGCVMYGFQELGCLLWIFFLLSRTTA